MPTIKNIIFLEYKAFKCIKCKNFITQFLKAHLDIYNFHTKLWERIIVSECPHCGELFGIINLPVVIDKK